MTNVYCILFALCIFISCKKKDVNASESPPKTPQTVETLKPISIQVGPDSLIRIDKQWKGDFDGMKKRRVIRALVAYNATNFFFDNLGQPRGISHDALRAFEEFINRNKHRHDEKIHVIQIPVSRDHLIGISAQRKCRSCSREYDHHGNP